MFDDKNRRQSEAMTAQEIGIDNEFMRNEALRIQQCVKKIK